MRVLFNGGYNAGLLVGEEGVELLMGAARHKQTPPVQLVLVVAFASQRLGHEVGF
jgi:hypothetical protein